MSSDVYLSSTSKTSGRTVIVANEGDSVWAYLTHSGSLRPERDCWLFNTPTAANDPDLDRYRAASLPPPAPATTIHATGILATEHAGRWSVRWSDDGAAAAVALEDVDVGVLAISETRGMSRYLLVASAWGRPWDEQLLMQLGLIAHSP